LVALGHRRPPSIRSPASAWFSCSDLFFEKFHRLHFNRITTEPHGPTTTTIYLNPGIALYAQELAAKMPGDLKVCYFVNSGSEANDLAVLMARA
jgi:hypothetical protein